MTRVFYVWIAVAALVASAGAALVADVLVLRDGRRVEGVLLEIRGDSIEFETAGPRGRRVERYRRGDVRAIQFDDRFDPRLGYDTGARRDGDPGPVGRSGLRERTVQVQAREGWTRTGLMLRAGQTVQFAASGEIRWGPNRKDGPAGERNSPYNQNRPMPRMNAAALIGRIGEQGDPFFIGGDRSPVRVRASGELWLGINDDYLQDNTGWFTVVIGY
jgi:hypothetical protein